MPGVSRIVTSVLNLFEARNMSEHCVSMPLLAKDVVRLTRRLAS